MTTLSLKEQGFYHSPAWRRIRRLALQQDRYLCQDCLDNRIAAKAAEVHHIKPLEQYPDLALDLGNLRCLCRDCHEQAKKQKGRPKQLPPVRIIKA